jgi:transposase
METRDARSLSPEAQEALRRKAVRAVVEGGRTRTEVAELFGVTRQTVALWVKAYRARGERALEARPRGRPKGKGTRLEPWQMAQVAKTLRDRMPDQLKLPFYLWTREAVVTLVERRFGVRISLSTSGRYLKRWGFTPQKPMRRAYERNEEAVRRWLDEEYPAIRKRAKAEGAEIYWGDEMGLRSDHVAGRSWGLKGKTPVVDATGKRFGCNMISAITNRGRLHFMVFQGRFTGPVFLSFLRRLTRQAGRKVFLIVDGHPVHRARKVKAWLEANRERIELFYLPGYSPHLNPDEVLNQDVKANAVGRNRARTLPDLMHQVHAFLRSRQRRPHAVQRYFLERHVRYAAAEGIS